MIVEIVDNDEGEGAFAYFNLMNIVFFKYKQDKKKTLIHCSDDHNYYFNGDITKMLIDELTKHFN